MKHLLNLLAHADIVVIVIVALLAGVGITLYFYYSWVSFALLIVGDILLFLTTLMKMITKGSDDNIL